MSILFRRLLFQSCRHLTSSHNVKNPVANPGGAGGLPPPPPRNA